MTMSETTATYKFDGDDIYAIHEGQVIAKGTDLDAVQSDATDYLESLKTARAASAKKTATHIITPNGMKGKIMGRTPTMWGEEVTAKFENGQFGTFETSGKSNFQWVNEQVKTASAKPTDLEARLAAEYGADKKSLLARHDELVAIEREATRLASMGASDDMLNSIDHVRVAAVSERSQVKEALDHIDSQEEYIPEQPFQTRVVEQADFGTQPNNWLDVTTQQMIDESKDTDYDKMMAEGPSLFVTDLDNGALADAGSTREMATAHVMARTAAFEGPEVEDFRIKFVARTEVARRAELAHRQATTHKEAAVVESRNSDAPDSALFM